MFKWNTQRKLNNIGPGLCMAKWTQSTIHLGQGLTHSCHHPDPHHIPIEEIEINPAALHNTAYKKSVRKEMLEGKRPKECDYCWRIEDTGEYSDRVLMSQKFGGMKQLNTVNSIDDVAPSYLEISFSNVCNFACAYCGPTFSSKWASEIKSLGPYVNGYNNNHNSQYPDKEHNPYIKAFWEYLPSVYKNLKVLRLTGGEPLLSRYTEQFLNYIIENPNKDLTLTVNTNLGVPRAVLDKFISQLTTVVPCVNKIEIATSGEAYGSQAEYIRDGLHYQEWLDNCHTVLRQLPKAKLHLMCAYNVLSIASFTEFLKDIVKLKKEYSRVELSVSSVHSPDFLSPSVAPAEWRPRLIESLDYLRNNFNSETVDRFKQVIALFDEQKDKDIKSLRLFIEEYDRRRNKNFLKIFRDYNFIFV